MKDWLCKPTSLEEAKEIIERAVANGAGNRTNYSGDCYLFYGVCGGGIICTITPVFYDSAEILTIDQVREQFPLPDEKLTEVEFYKDIDWLLNAHKLGATHRTNDGGELYKIDYAGVHFYIGKKWYKSLFWERHEITTEHKFYPIDYSPLNKITEKPDKERVKWEDLKPNSVDWLEFAKNIGATHWHETEMKFAKAGDGWSASIFGDGGWDINDGYVCPSRYPKHWKQYLINYSPLESKTEGSERELWVEGAIKAMKEVHLTWDDKDPASEQKCRLYAEAIHDRIIKQK